MKRLIFAGIFSIIIFIVLFNIINFEKVEKIDNLVIFGDNIIYEATPFIENDCVYIPFDTVEKIIDEDIFYDELSSKIIITNYDYFLKYKVNESTYLENLEEKEISNVFKIEDGSIFIPITEFEELYNIVVSYNEEFNTIVIDYKEEATANVLFNKTSVYQDISTDSNVIDNINLNDEVLVYLDSLNHNRWYKVKTKNNIVGYVFKDNIQVNYVDKVFEEIEEKEKIIMYWQYGNDLSTLTSEEGVNVVSPTLYELANSKGEVDKLNTKPYVEKAHELGYKVWPIITNGIDDVDYSATDTSLLMNSESAREGLIRNIENIVLSDNLDGINIDFEAMKKEDKYLFVQFLRELAPIMHKHDKVLSTDIYFVEYMDRPGIGKASDYTVLMGYDQRGNWSSESGSIAEIDWTKENINSMIKDSNIPSYNIILGIPFYTRLWTEKTGSSAPIDSSIYTISGSLNYIDYYDLGIKYDEDSKQNYIERTVGSYTYKMWLEDDLSIKNRTNLVNEMELGGIAAWRKGFETENTWNIINETINGGNNE